MTRSRLKYVISFPKVFFWRFVCLPVVKTKEVFEVWRLTVSLNIFHIIWLKSRMVRVKYDDRRVNIFGILVQLFIPHLFWLHAITDICWHERHQAYNAHYIFNLSHVIDSNDHSYVTTVVLPSPSYPLKFHDMAKSYVIVTRTKASTSVLSNPWRNNL